MQSAKRVVVENIDCTMIPPMQLVNVVATVAINKKIDLNLLSEKLLCTYRPEGRFQMVVVKRRRTPTFMVFASGKIVCNGAKSISEAYEATKNLWRELLKVVGQCSLIEFKVVNLVSSCDVGFKVNRYYLQHEGFWLDDRFCGVTLYYNKSVRVICFHTGKVYMTGVKTEKELEKIWIDVYPLIYKHKFPFNQ